MPFNFSQIQGAIPPKKKLSTKKPPSSVVNSGKASFKSKQIKPAAARRNPVSGIIYGDELFADSRKKEREIVVKFYDFTPNKLRISSDKKFIIAYHYTEEQERLFNLHYFPDASIDFDSEKNLEYIIDLSNCVSYTNLDSLEEVKLKISKLWKEEFLEGRKKKLEELKEEERLEQIEKDKLEAEAELEEAKNELDSGNITEFSNITDSKINSEIQKEEKSNKISAEEIQEDGRNELSSKETTGRGNFNFTQINEIKE